jgi:hypothetical protein
MPIGDELNCTPRSGYLCRAQQTVPNSPRARLEGCSTTPTSIGYVGGGGRAADEEPE